MNPAHIIAANLAALPHPDGTPRVLPAFNTRLLPEPLQQQMTQTSKDIGECIVHLLELNGYQVVSNEEANRAAQPAEPASMANVHCTMCDQKLFSLRLTNPTHAVTDGRAFIGAVSNLNPECPHQ